MPLKIKKETKISNKPKTIDEHTWWYENKKSITIVCEAHSDTKQIVIPYREIVKSMKRTDFFYKGVN